MNKFKILALNINLNIKDIINLKKKYIFKFIKKKIIYKKLKIYGNFILIITNLKILQITKIIPLLYLYKKNNFSILKIKKLKYNKTFKLQSLLFINLK